MTILRVYRPDECDAIGIPLSSTTTCPECRGAGGRWRQGHAYRMFWHPCLRCWANRTKETP